MVVFMDMLRTDLLNLYNENIKTTVIDDFFMQRGGTTFTNIFTPCPDTARSLASFWTGKPCYETNCNKRTKYPSVFLDEFTLLDELKNKGVEIKIYSETKMIFPKKFQSSYYYLSNLEEYETSSKNDQFLFVDIPTAHYALDDNGYTNKSVNQAHTQLSLSLNYLLKKIQINQFDYIIYFSDHGHLLTKESLQQSKIIDKFISIERAKIFLHIQLKNERHNLKNNTFQSITFLRNVITELYNEKHKSINSFEIKKVHTILIEDFFSISTEIKQFPDIWNLRTEDNDNIFAFLTRSTKYENFNELDTKYNLISNFPHLEQIVNEHVLYKEYLRVMKGEIKSHFFQLDEKKYYFGGEPRRISIQITAKRITRKIFNYLKIRRRGL